MTHTRYCCVVVDLDGTLLWPDKRLARGAAAAVARWREAGIKTIIATARPPRSAEAFQRALGLDGPAVVYNGAGIYDYAARRFAGHWGIDAALACEVEQVARAFGGVESLSAEVMDRGFFVPLRGGASPLVNDTAREGFAPEPVASVNCIGAGPFTKLMPYCPDGIDRLAEALRERFGGRLYLARTDGHLLQIGAGGVEKSAALETIFAEAGIGWANVAAAGDNHNDLETMRRAAWSVAPSDAPRPVRRIASVLAADPDGIIEQIDALLTP